MSYFATYAIASYLTGRLEAESDPEAGNDTETTTQPPFAYFLFNQRQKCNATHE
jgi:hypothetical protein